MLRIFQDPQIDYPIHDLDLSFADYIKQSEKIIALTRQNFGQHPELTIKNNAPFEFIPNQPHPKCGALLIHGLLDSPFVMHDIGHYLQSQGLLVRSILLPGHGTVPGALLNTHYSEWLQAVKYGVATLKQDVEKIFLVGVSTGASLSIYHAAKDRDITGLIILSPAFKIRSPFTFMSNWYRALNNVSERTKWFSVNEELDEVKYQSIAFNAIYQVYQLGLDLQKIDFKIWPGCPLLMILSDEDKIVCSRTSINYFQQMTHPLNRALIYSAKSLKFSDQRILVRNSCYPSMNILNFCHITLPVAPSNPHYGKNGTYILASHLEKNIQYGAFDNAEIRFYNLLQRMKIIPYQYQRLTFNPDFEFMKNQMGEFISCATTHQKTT